MLTLFWIVLWAGFAALVVAAGVTIHVRRREALAASFPLVDDAAVEEILQTGELFVDEGPFRVGDYVDVDEPLDSEEIDDEEGKFWSESWDEPTEW